MKPAMRVSILLACSALVFHGGHAETLSDADRETLLGNLEKIRETSESKTDARFRIALAAYRNAIGSDDAAIDLYLNCVEKVNFEQLHKKAADFRDWKGNERENLADPGLRLALRHQLRWLMLTLEAASEKPNRVKLAGEAQDAVDSIFRDADKLKNQQDILSQAVTSTVFARAYDINHVKVENWKLSPIEIAAIYDEILLPPYRKPSALASLRAGWIKRIQQETVKMEIWPENHRSPRRENRDDKRSAMASDMQSPEYLKFLKEDLPKLQWDMEVDLYTYGDQAGAAVRMLALLEKHIGDPSAREWADAFKRLLKPEIVMPVPKIGGETAP